jgi:multidrug efflux system membrane fusion protein
VDADPVVVTGQVAERDIPDVRLGTQAVVNLLTGETVKGDVSFISRTADPDTRTFTVEITVPNPDGALRAGVTAEAQIPLEPVRVHRLSPGVLTLSDEGEIGVRTVDPDGTVRFMPVKIAMQDTDGFWVTGLPQRVTIITVGQEYVVDGQTVAVEVEDENA